MRRPLMKRILGITLLLVGSWGLISPQANLGIPALRWISKYSFAGETLIGVVLLGTSYYLLGAQSKSDG
jgi:hypothetical protein